MQATPRPPTVMADMTAATASASTAPGGQAKPKAGAAPSHTVHLVGQLTDVVFSFLGPATAALAEVGHRQTVVVMEDPRFAYLPGEFSPSVDLLVIKHDTRWRRWREALPLFWRVLRQRQPTAVHFHGFIPLTFGGAMVRLAGLRPTLYYSPHGSKAHGRHSAIGRLMAAASRLVLNTRALSAIVAADSDDLAAAKSFARTAEVPNQIPEVFSLTPRAEAPDPVVVAGHGASQAEAAHLFAQLGALFSGAQVQVGFQWLGAVSDEGARAALRAASVSASGDEGDKARAQRLSRAWVYLAQADSRGFAVHIAEAMAAGVPCIALDTPTHRALITHGVDGFLYQDQAQVIELTAKLVDEPQTRRTIGQAARASELRRQTLSKFTQSVERLYGEG